MPYSFSYCFFFSNSTATTEIYTLSLHDALPILDLAFLSQALHHAVHPEKAIAEAWRILKKGGRIAKPRQSDRKSTRLNSSHANISYAVFCLKKKKRKQK